MCGDFDDQERIDASANWFSPGGSWSVSLYGKNLSDEANWGNLTSIAGLWTAGPMQKGRFLGMEVNQDYLKDMAEFASVENLRKKEQENYFWRSGSRVQAKDVNDPNTYKVRKAKVVGFRDYFDDDQVAELEAMLDSRLMPVFGYTSTEREVSAHG